MKSSLKLATSFLLAAAISSGAGVLPRAQAAPAAAPNKGTEVLDIPAPHADLPAGFTIRHPKDGAEMVWVPAGWFRMGTDKETAIAQAAQLGYKDYHEIAAEESFPEHLVYVQGFFIDKTEVTMARWKQFTDANPGWKQTTLGEEKPTVQPTWTGPELDPEKAQLPIGEITWKSAQEYANWAGKQLPTEAMWEKAARGTDARWYPWGNEKPDPTIHGVISMDNSLPGPKPVGSFPKGASPYGALDMAGNVYEWTSDWVEPYPNSPEPNGSWGHQYVILRGGSFYHTRHSYRTSKRFGFQPDVTYFHVGMRSAWIPPDNFDVKQYAVK